MSYTCPNCQKVLKHKRSLDRHVAQYHADAPEAPEAVKANTGGTMTPDAPETPPELAYSAPAPVDELRIKAPELPTEYYCIDCGHKGLTNGQPNCPGCGSGLAWAEVKR